MTRADFLFQSFRDRLDFEPTPCQEKLLRETADFLTCADADILVVNGYAGTGKTTAMGAVIAALRAQKTPCVLLAPTGRAVGARGEFAFPPLLYAVWVLKGFGMALVHNCSFPMVVELCSSKKIGKFTGYYYAASMSAQTVTPVLLGLVLNGTKAWRTLPVYAAILTCLSFTVFTALVKNIKAGKVANVKGLEAIGAED